MTVLQRHEFCKCLLRKIENYVEHSRGLCHSLSRVKASEANFVEFR